jgi:hypothetical protein
MFNIADFELNDTAALTVQNPSGEDMLVDGKPVIINLYGSGSPQFVKAKHKADNASTLRVQSMFRGKTVNNAAALSEQELVEKLEACTASVENFPIPASEIYANPKLGYITKQVVKFLDDDANFMKKSTKA